MGDNPRKLCEVHRDLSEQIAECENILLGYGTMG